MDDIVADFCCALLGVIPVFDELGLLLCDFTFSLEFVFSFTTV